MRWPPSSWKARTTGLVALSAGLALLAAGCVPPRPATPARIGVAPIPGAVTIMGPSELSAQQIADYVCHVSRCTPVASGGTWKPEVSTVQLAQMFLDEGNLAGIRGDVAFAQSVLETGWFAWPSSPWPEPLGHPDDGTWPGNVLALDHNYAGLGAFDGTNVYMREPNPTAGVRAQIQHLRDYADINATPDNLGAPLQPRVGSSPSSFMNFRYQGQAPTWVQLNGKWAVPGTTYGQTILSIYNNMRTYAGLSPVQASSSGTLDSQSIDNATVQLLHETTSRN